MKEFWICLLSQKKQKQKLINGIQLSFPFAQKKKPSTTQKKQLLEWENILANDMTNERLVSKIHKQLMQLNIKKMKESNQKIGRRPE